MNRGKSLVLLLTTGWLVSASGALAAPMGTAFTYQGKLELNGVPVSNFCNLEFTLWDDPDTGTLLGTDLVLLHEVDDGLFTVTLDFESGVFEGNARWLELAVQCPGDPTPTVLSPRQLLTPAPYAQFAPLTASTPWDGLTGIPPGFADGVDEDTTYSAGTGIILTATEFELSSTYQLPQACGLAQVSKWDGVTWTCADDADSGGDITGVTVEPGLLGGGLTGDVTVSVEFAGSGSANAVARTDHNHNGAYATPEHSHSSLDAADGTPANALSVDGSGNVGIGTATPAATLHVEGTVALQAGVAVAEFSADGTLAGNSDLAVPTEQAVKAYVDASLVVATAVPIGTVTAWIKSFPNTPALPDGWVECNGQTLSDAASAYDGQVIPNLNGQNRFLRGSSASGTTGGVQSQNLNHSLIHTITDFGYDGSARNYANHSFDNRPPFYDVVWIMKVR